MSTTSSTDVGTPIHISSGSLHSFVNEGGGNHYPTSEQLDYDEAIDLDDHVNSQDGHVTNMHGHVIQQMKLSASEESNEEASTAEEGLDSVPNYESTTTDNIVDSVAFEPIDYIESNPRLSTAGELHYHANGHGALIGSRNNDPHVPSPLGQRYENWSVMLQLDDGTKKNRVLKRNKGSRVTKIDRQRVPYPLPRPGKIKTVHPRPSPMSRKRRYSGRSVRALQPANASEETDMAQADEMGEGEGRDDGFIDGGGQEPFRRRSKKRAGGIHTLLPSLGHGSPQSSPSNTPVSRRKISTRKSRLKPRTRKQNKPQLASGDISTQESTTQGPGSSDTSEARASLDEASQLRVGEDDVIESDSDRDYEDARSITPNPRDVGVVNAIKLRNSISPLTDSKTFLHRDQVSDIEPPPITVMHMSSKDSLCSASDDNLQRDSNETSDTDLTPLPRTHQTNWMNRKFESDLSTAPFSSETSDMETSGNERVLTTDGGSATDLNPPKAKAPDSPPTPASSPSPMGKVPHRQIPSGSSGDEIKKNHLSVKSKPFPKPAPPKRPVEPPIIAKLSSAVTKKPLNLAKSNPLGPKGGGQPTSSSRSQPSESGSSPSRSRSIKVNIPPKPKPPPVAAKPVSKPEVRVRPTRSASIQPLVGSGGSSGAPLMRFEGKPRANSVEGEPSSMRKIHSDSDLGVARGVVRRSPTLGARKLAQVREEVEKKRQSTPPPPRPPPPQTTIRPTIPGKPKRQPSEKMTKPVERVSPVEQNISNVQKHHSQPSDSSKTPSSSEATTSGPSQSPAGSPHPSPSLSKRLGTLQKIAILPKKPSIKSHHRALSDSARLVRKIETADLGSPLTVVSVSTAGQQHEDGESKTSASNHCMQLSNGSPENQTTPTNGTTSPPPPPVPPRPKVKRKSSHRELVIPVSETGSARTSPSGDSVGHRKKLSAPRRPPPSPPSPSPARGLATEAQPTVNELTDIGSRMSHSSSRNEDICRRPGSTAINDHYDVGVASWDEDASPQPYMYAVVNKLKLSPEKPRSKTPDFLSRPQTLLPADADPKKNSDSELEVNSTRKGSKVVRRQSSRRAPPKPPKYDTPDETTSYIQVNMEAMAANQQKLSSQSSGSRSSTSPPRDDITPPPLPSQPIPKRKATVSQKTTSTVTERPKCQDPVYDVIPDLPKRGCRPKYREYEEIDLIDDDLPPELMEKDEATKEIPVELVRTVHEALPHKQTQKKSRGNYAQLPIEDLRENWKTSPHSKRRAAKSFSGNKSQSLMYMRFSSERLNQRRVLTLEPVGSGKSLVHRTPSLDRLDDRMSRSLRHSIHYGLDSSSSDEEDISGIVSPVSAALPKVPSQKTLYSSPKSQKTKQGKSTGGASDFVPPDMEPLYQYINTAEFLRDTSDPSARLQVPAGPGQPKQNQLEIARQLSQRKLWCEQPDIIKSGLLKTLGEEEKKLQEAMFEVITSEASYLRSLDVLIDHFMDDPGMNPNLPEGRRVLDKRQHHVIFSNVREVRDVSARFLNELESRQRENPIVRNISDIVLDYAENHFECYVRYCTNQIYQTRELQDCIENNLMFREYLRRLESHKICQNLNMQSFLLLPMQRITRLPLLILAILNRTPLDYTDHGLVETSLRTVQKLVTSCNDGARKMERTEQLHEIHKKLYFGKLKPFPLVSVSRQLERKGTLVQLQVDQKLFGKRKISKKPLYVFVFTDYIIITKKKKDPKGDYLYKVVDHASRAMVDLESIETLSGMTFPKPVLGDQDPITEAMWAVSVAATKHAFLLILLDNVHHQTSRYLLLASNDTDKTRWLDSLSRQDIEREDEKIYQTWDCPQVQAVFDYVAQQPDELDLHRGDVVKVYRKMADGWYEGERLRDLQCGWFPSNFTMEIQNEHTRARNLRETHRLNSLLAANDMILSTVHNPR